MAVTDLQVATLRAQLAGDPEEHRRLLARFDERSDGRPYVTLTNAAFVEAVDRKFPGDAGADDIIAFVADVRSRSEQVAGSLDPRVAERVLLAAVTGAEVSDLDPRQVRRSQRVLLNALVVDADLDGADLDEFMATARGLADRLLS
jgi:hypothetical protein